MPSGWSFKVSKMLKFLLKTGWGFMGSKMLSGFGWRYKSRFRRLSGWKEMPELSTGWSFKASKIMN